LRILTLVAVGMLFIPAVFAIAQTTTSTVSISITIPGEAPSDPDPDPAPSPVGGGGGGVSNPARLVLSGIAYPHSVVTILKDGAVLKTIQLGDSAEFSATINGLSPGSTTISVWAADRKGVKSVTLGWTIALISGATTTISGIYLPPTISLNRTLLHVGDTLIIFGETNPLSEVFVFVNSTEVVEQTIASESGLWNLNFDTEKIEVGAHVARAKSIFSGGQSVFSDARGFELAPKGAPLGCIADLNNDGIVDIIDFSILLFNWGIPTNPLADFNGDNVTDIVDFSIMLFFWGTCPSN